MMRGIKFVASLAATIVLGAIVFAAWVKVRPPYVVVYMGDALNGVAYAKAVVRLADYHPPFRT